jgi:glycosyltransferase involved in cell wall biosynthesis
LKIVLISNYASSLINFRGDLMSEFVKAGHEVIACAPGESIDTADKLKSKGVSYKAILLDRTGINPIKDLFSFLELATLFRRIRPDIVFNYTIKPVIYGSLAARLAGVSNTFSMITGLGYVFTGASLRQRIIRALVCRLYRRALSNNRAIFFLNADDLTLFVRSGLVSYSQKTLLINGEGIDINYYTYPSLPNADQGGQTIKCSETDLMNFPHVSMASKQPRFLLIARLIKDKGIFEYVDAARVLKKRHPQAVFRLLGPFDRNPSAIRESEIKGWQEEGIIEYLGEAEDVRPFIADANVYVLPSYREGLPRTVLEAMAMGRPIVTTDAPGCRETVRDGDNGFLVPVRDVDSLALAMERFILHPELIAKMGSRSREIAEGKYDVRKVNAVIMQTMGLFNEKTI